MIIALTIIGLAFLWLMAESDWLEADLMGKKPDVNIDITSLVPIVIVAGFLMLIINNTFKIKSKKEKRNAK